MSQEGDVQVALSREDEVDMLGSDETCSSETGRVSATGAGIEQF